MKNFAKLFNKELNINKDEKEILNNLCLTDRYVMYKVGPVLLANVCIIFISFVQKVKEKLESH